MRPRGILEAALYVREIDRARTFYHRLFDLRELAYDPNRHVFFQCGRSVLLLFRAAATSHGLANAPTHGAEGPGHLAFEMAHDDLPAWKTHLAACGVAVEKEVTWPGGGRSIYFRDPDDNCLELATRDVWQLEGG
jgi:catechol 2,3-dioxygenase-like lactoylglutathione lyase family enzyme